MNYSGKRHFYYSFRGIYCFLYPQPPERKTLKVWNRKCRIFFKCQFLVYIIMLSGWGRRGGRMWREKRWGQKLILSFWKEEAVFPKAQSKLDSVEQEGLIEGLFFSCNHFKGRYGLQDKPQLWWSKWNEWESHTSSKQCKSMLSLLTLSLKMPATWMIHGEPSTQHSHSVRTPRVCLHIITQNWVGGNPCLGSWKIMEFQLRMPWQSRSTFPWTFEILNELNHVK